LDLIPVEITPGVLLIRSGETLSSLTCRVAQPAEGWYLVTKARESSAGSEALLQAPSSSQRLHFQCDTNLSVYSEVERCLSCSCQRCVMEGFDVGQLVSRRGKTWEEGVQFKADPLSVGIEGEEGVATDGPEEATPVSIDTDYARLGAATSDYPGGQAICVECYSRASTAVLRVGEHGNQEEINSVRVPVHSSGRHRGAGQSSIGEIHARGHPALADERFERIVFVSLGAISADVGNQRGTSEGALCVRVFDPGGSCGCLDKSNRHLKKTHSRGAVGVDLLTFTPVNKADLMAEVVQKLSEWMGIRRVISIVDRYESYGVEGMNKQILPYLRTPVHDVQVAKKWSNPTILSLVFFLVNDGVDSETGRPLDAMFWSDDSPYLRLPDPVDLSTITSTWPVVGDFFEGKDATPRTRAEYLVEEDVLMTEHALDQVSAHGD